MALAFEKIDAQAKKDTERQRDRKRGWTRFLPKGWRSEPLAVAAAPAPGTRIVRDRVSTVKPMGVDEAAIAMESSGQDVYVFRDAANDRVSVLYRRRDGDLGLIVAEC